MSDELDVAVAGASDVGAVRDHNEDLMLVGDLDTRQVVDVTAIWRASADRGPLLVVCDGMGGVEGGEVASELAAQVLWREMKQTPATRDPEVFARLLRRATRVANHDVHALARREPGLRGMGTTVSAAGIVGDRLVVATVGDSRAYVLRAGVIVQVTRDQSLSSALLAAGHSPGEAASAGSATSTGSMLSRSPTRKWSSLCSRTWPMSLAPATTMSSAARGAGSLTVGSRHLPSSIRSS